MIEDLIEKFKIAGEVYLNVKVKPASAKTGIKEVMEDGTVKIAIAAQPVKGRANRELINYLSRIFICQKGEISILSGLSEKTKLIKISKINKRKL